MLPFKLLSFGFSFKEILTLLTVMVKAIHCKTESDMGKYYH